MCFLIFQSLISLKGSCLLCSLQCEKNTAVSRLGLRASSRTSTALGRTWSPHTAQAAVGQSYHVLLKIHRCLSLPVSGPHLTLSFREDKTEAVQATWHTLHHKAMQQNSDQTTCPSFQAWWN